MKTIVKFIVIFLLTGCGGQSFTAVAETTNVDDSGIATGGALGTGGAAATGGTSMVATGGAHETGGAPGKGGSVTGGAPSATGGVRNNTGGTPSSTGGAPSSTGGAPVVDACALVTHDNGLGQTWQDCVPRGTYDLAQALTACKASFGSGCLVKDPQVACEGVGMVYTSDYVHAWIYSAKQGAGVHAGDVLEYLPGTSYVCPNWPGPTGTWN